LGASVPAIVENLAGEEDTEDLDRMVKPAVTGRKPISDDGKVAQSRRRQRGVFQSVRGANSTVVTSRRR
jgi:hypothetical protein